MDAALNIPPLASQNLARIASRADAAPASEDDVDRDRKLKKVCADFEALFISYIFQTMRKTVPESATGAKMPGKDTYMMMMDQKLSEDLSRRGGIGLQDMLYNQMKRASGTPKPDEQSGIVGSE